MPDWKETQNPQAGRSSKTALPPEIRAIWTDLYRFYETFARIGNTSEEWQRCAGAMAALLNRHGRHPLAMAMFPAVYDYLGGERKAPAPEEAIRRKEYNG